MNYLLTTYLAFIGFGFLVLGFMAARVTEYRVAVCFALCMAVCAGLSLFALAGAI